MASWIRTRVSFHANSLPFRQELVPRNSLHLLLVGNGSYLNRGCEAIVRGTMAILRRTFGEGFRATVASFGLPEVLARQANEERDPLIQHVALPTPIWPTLTLGSPRWWKATMLRASGRLLRLTGNHYLMYVPPDVRMDLSGLDELASSASLALQVGGDNFSLDYAPPLPFFQLDNYFQAKQVPVVLWGASVGPFEAAPLFAKRTLEHLQRLNLILLREGASYEYLRARNISRIGRMSDPAFAMEAVEPRPEKLNCRLPEEPLGLNFSPLMARYAVGGNAQRWVDLCAAMVGRVCRDIDRPVLFVPHVTNPGNNDHTLLQTIRSRMSHDLQSRVLCLGDGLSAAETKWVIARCAVFAGARTHATIAAMSSYVPTLSLGYSIKARGLNQEVFGTQEYCMQPRELSAATFSERLQRVFQQAETIRQHLRQRMPAIRERAFEGGAHLAAVLVNSRELPTSTATKA